MLHQNIQNTRKSKGLSQEELALKLNVVRQTVSKWERGLSVPDAELLVALSEALDTPVSTLLGETVIEAGATDVQILAEKLEVLNAQFARMQASRRRAAHLICISLSIVVALTFLALGALGSSYLAWDFSNPEYAIAGTVLHGFEWVFVRLAPVALVAAIAGAVATRAER